MKFPVRCPSCESKLHVSKLVCQTCETQVLGNYALPVFLYLEPEEQEFIIEFLMSSGSIKEMAQKIGKSYPTVRNRLDDLIEKINQLENERK